MLSVPNRRLKTKKLRANQTYKNPTLVWSAFSPPSEGLGEALITDAGGYPYQFFYYSAFGESLVQQNASTGHFATPYKFNAKELDMETGNYYYGARYYNPQTSVWLSVDPLATKYPHATPYNFVEGNPIMLIDPTGLGPTPWQKIKYRFKRFAYRIKNAFTKKPEMGTQLSEAQVTAERLSDAVNVKTVGFGINLGVKNFKIGRLVKFTLDASALTVKIDPHTGEPNVDFMGLEAGIWLGDSDVGIQGQIGLVSGSEQETKFLNGSIAGAFNIGNNSGAKVTQYSGSVWSSRKGLLTGEKHILPTQNPSRMIDLGTGTGELEPMLIIGGEMHMGLINADVEVNVDGVANAFTREGTGVGREWHNNN